MKIPKRKIKWIIVLICLAVLFSPYLKVEYLTWRHGVEFTDRYKATHMISPVEYMKVMDYSATQAKVYYVEVDHTASFILDFSKQNGQWVMDRWDVVWSREGSADGFIWPYYR